MSEFILFLKKTNLDLQEWLFTIGVLALGYIYGIYVNYWLIFALGILFFISMIAMNIHFYNEDRKMFKRFHRQTEGQRIEFKLKMEQLESDMIGELTNDSL